MLHCMISTCPILNAAMQICKIKRSVSVNQRTTKCFEAYNHLHSISEYCIYQLAKSKTYVWRQFLGSKCQQGCKCHDTKKLSTSTSVGFEGSAPAKSPKGTKTIRSLVPLRIRKVWTFRKVLKGHLAQPWTTLLSLWLHWSCLKSDWPWRILLTDLGNRGAFSWLESSRLIQMSHGQRPWSARRAQLTPPILPGREGIESVDGVSEVIIDLDIE